MSNRCAQFRIVFIQVSPCFLKSHVYRKGLHQVVIAEKSKILVDINQCSSIDFNEAILIYIIKVCPPFLDGFVITIDEQSLMFVDIRQEGWFYSALRIHSWFFY